jgi:hypothetical protein
LFSHFLFIFWTFKKYILTKFNLTWPIFNKYFKINIFYLTKNRTSKTQRPLLPGLRQDLLQHRPNPAAHLFQKPPVQQLDPRKHFRPLAPDLQW